MAGYTHINHSDEPKNDELMMLIIDMFIMLWHVLDSTFRYSENRHVGSLGTLHYTLVSTYKYVFFLSNSQFIFNPKGKTFICII